MKLIVLYLTERLRFLTKRTAIIIIIIIIIIIKSAVIVWNAHNTVFGSKRSAYGDTQRAPKSPNTNRFLRQKRLYETEATFCGTS